MARPRKNAPAADTEAKKVETAVEVKAEETPVVNAEAPAEAPAAPEKKRRGRKPASEKTAAAAAKTPAKKKPGRKPAAKKTETTEKKTPGRKPALKSEITIQYGAKSYAQDELVKIAKDVWQYDLNQKPAELTSVELYVKPEESMAYYVMNKKFTGSFYL